MTRAAFTSACGDPFVLSLCVKFFKERFYDEVDKYYINVNNHAGVPSLVIGELLSKLSQDPKIHLLYHPRGIGNGPPLTEMTLICKEDLIVLIEDDFFVFKPGEVNKCFQQIESDLTDAIGSPRNSCGQEIVEVSQKKYNIDLSGYGDRGVNFWPAGFFCKRSDLLRTDLNFGSKTWQAGEYSPELNHTFKEINHADTFGWAAIQLRALGVRFQAVPQWHASPNEIEQAERKEDKWAGEANPGWIHGGSLSSGWGGYLSGRLPDTSTDSAKQEIESRVAFWTLAQAATDGYDAFKQDYVTGIKNLIQGAKLSIDRIDRKTNMYRKLMNL